MADGPGAHNACPGGHHIGRGIDSELRRTATPLIVTLILATIISLLPADALLPGPRWLFTLDSPMTVCSSWTPGGSTVVRPGCGGCISTPGGARARVRRAGSGECVVIGSATNVNSGRAWTGALVKVALLITFRCTGSSVSVGQRTGARARTPLPDLAFPQDSGQPLRVPPGDRRSSTISISDSPTIWHSVRRT